jgi:hypothetical protein
MGKSGKNRDMAAGLKVHGNSFAFICRFNRNLKHSAYSPK